MKWQYKEEKSFEDRVNEVMKVKSKYPHRIPVIVEKRPESTLPDLPNKKYLVEKDSTVAQFLYTIKKRLPQVDANQSIFFFVNKHIVLLTSIMEDLYIKYKDKDQFLYISYSDENVFGAEETSFNAEWEYKDSKSYEKRLEEAQRIKQIYPDSVPIIVQKHPKSRIPDLERKKYIVPKKRPFSSFYYSIRRQIKLSEEKGIFLIVQNVSPNLSSTVGDIYQNLADNDEFLYICYSDENTFGMI